MNKFHSINGGQKEQEGDMKMDGEEDEQDRKRKQE